jgi:lipopolysaccharide/colanic/teichoic acid biosynthesis glycosyltransferase
MTQRPRSTPSETDVDKMARPAPPAEVVRRASAGGQTFPISVPRRLLDILVATILLALTAPLLLLAAVLVVFDDGRPVLFHQLRVGEGGVPFRLAKLRSMRTGQAGGEVTAEDDPRVTRLGRFLRRTSIDELPQLWHVLRGHMTLVGPRPETVSLAERYPVSCRPVLAARPGLTGPSQLRYRERSATPQSSEMDVETWYLEVMVPLRTQADLDYLAQASVRTTVRYLLLTAMFVVGLVDMQVSAPKAT